MNRIAFYLFKFKGESVTFLNFTMRLKILQTSNYQKRLAFWLNIIDDNGTEMIAREDIEKVLKLSIRAGFTTLELERNHTRHENHKHDGGSEASCH